MNTKECINSRRSRRVFLDNEVSEDKVLQIIEAGVNAPSSVDCQPWHFIIVNDNEKLKQLAKLKENDGHNHIISAPLSIIVCVDMEKSPSRYLEDGVTATQNMLLIIHELGLGSVYLSASKLSNPKIAESVRNTLFIPENIMPVTILPIGYPDASEELDKKQILDINKVTHYNNW